MKNLLFTLAITVLGLAVSQPGVSATKNQDISAGKETFSVELTRNLDSRKLKQGDQVEAKLTARISLPNGTTAARGAKVIGHVNEAKVRSNSDSESRLEITFDKVSISNGEERLISGTVLAAAPRPDVETAAGGLADGYNGMAEMIERGVTIAPSGQSTPTLNDQSRGALGMKNLKLTDGVFTSTAKEVRLDSGTRMLLSVSMTK